MTTIEANTENILISRVLQKQNELGLSDYKFAEMLGVGRSLWQLSRSGKRDIGLTLLKAVVCAFPELIPEVIKFLRNGYEQQ